MPRRDRWRGRRPRGRGSTASTRSAGGDRVDRVGALDGGGRRLRDAQVAHLAGLDERRHRPPGLLDGHATVDAVLVVQVDDLDPEARERRVARRRDVLGPAVDADERAVGAALVAELRGEHDLVAAARDGPSHELLVGEGTVHVGGVEEVDPEVEGLVDRGDRLVVVSRAVELAHPHAAQTLGRHLQALAQCASPHGHPLTCEIAHNMPASGSLRHCIGDGATIFLIIGWGGQTSSARLYCSSVQAGFVVWGRVR